MKYFALSICFGLMAYVTATTAKAELVVTIAQVGPDVVFTSDGGSINLTDLSFVTSSDFSERVIPNLPFAGLGTQQTIDIYNGISGPSSFGTGRSAFWDSSTGPDAFGFNNGFPANNVNDLFVPAGYTSGDPLIFSSTFNNTDLATMGIRLGTHTWTWGSGANADSFTLITTPIPEPSSAMLLAGLGSAFCMRRRRQQ